MSILIKGMKMPECCDKCFFAAWSKLHQTAWCDLKRGPTFSDYSVEYRTKRANFCPLLEVPPHGRLGDIDKLAKRIEYERYHHEHTDDFSARHHIAEYSHFLKEIADTPAVIPAEESNMDSFIRIFEEDDEEDGMDSFIRILKD